MSGYWRVLDHRGILHLARADMAGEALCGKPPVGTRLSDPIIGAWPPGAATAPYVSLCPVCSERIWR